jgi:hypothetical protein
MRLIIGLFLRILTAFFAITISMHSTAFSQMTASISGCPVFPSDNVWNTPVDNLPVDANSPAYIATIGAATGLHPDFGSGLWDGGPIGIPYNVVPGTQQKVIISFDYADESDPGPYPIPANPAIEGGSQSSGDRHVLVLDKDNCMLYETWSTYPQPDGSWHAGSGSIFYLRSNALRPSSWTSSDAAGLPILPGLIRYDEIVSGEIRHAIRFTAPQTKREFIWPARHYASNLTGQQYPPMGERFRLKSGFDISSFSPEVQVILRALKRYGMVLADNGSAWFLSGAPDSRWDDDVLVNELRLVKGSDFEAIDESSLIISQDSGQAKQSSSDGLNTDPPANPVKLIFIHHSTGENWLSDGNGGLGISLRDNNYFTSDTNYGWGPNSIGDTTDIGHWWLWFRGPDSSTYMSALNHENGRHAFYSRLSDEPAGENSVILFKSCFPNSALQGSPDDPVPLIDSNPLRGQGSGSGYHTVANAKGIYADLLEYFGSHQEKLFIAITAPPLSDPSYSANARAFNEWLVNEWLKSYPYKNVAVFDFYNVLTTNGGNPNIDDLNLTTGNHHRWWNSAIQHKTDGDNDSNPNILEYQTSDDHPSQAGNLKASGEFLPLLNIYYHCWNGTGDCPGSAPQTEYSLNIQKTGSGTGSVTSADGKISCDPDCSDVYNTGTVVTLTAAPSAGSAFVNWTGCTPAPTDQKKCTVTVTSEATVTVTFNPVMTLTYPDSGESLQAGNKYTIRWTYAGTPGSYVKIELLKNGILNRTISPFALTGSGGNGSYSWTTPSTQTPGNDFRIRVTSTSKSSYTDTSNGNFSITAPPPPGIIVSVPNGNENWKAGSPYQIKWTYTGNPGSYVKIELLKNGSFSRTISFYTPIGSAGNGSYKWTIPSAQIPGNDYRLRVTSMNNSTYKDTSDNNFAISK